MTDDRTSPETKYRRAQDLARDGARDDAVRLLREAIEDESRRGDDDLRLFYAMNETLAQWLHPRPRVLPEREWQWSSVDGSLHGVRTAIHALRWWSRSGTRDWSDEQSASHFVAFGPRGLPPDDVLRELAILLEARLEPWFVGRETRLRAAQQAARSPRRVRASDYYAISASDFGVEVPPTLARTRDEHLHDLRQTEDARLRVDAATALRGFPGDAEVLHALVAACHDERIAKDAFLSLVDILALPWPSYLTPIGLIGDLVVESVHGGAHCPRPERARRIGLAWLARFVTQRADGDRSPAFTDAVEEPEGSEPHRLRAKDPACSLEALRALPSRSRFWAGLLRLVRARTDAEAERVLAELPICDPSSVESAAVVEAVRAWTRDDD